MNHDLAELIAEMNLTLAEHQVILPGLTDLTFLISHGVCEEDRIHCHLPTFYLPLIETFLPMSRNDLHVAVTTFFSS